MKTLIIGSFLFLMPLLSDASAGNVYCKVGAQILNVSDENGWECRQYLLTTGSVSTSQACFTGQRRDVIAILNSLAEAGYFDGTDGEYIKGAKFSGRKSISYIYVDESNEESSKASLGRCTKDFFALI